MHYIEILGVRINKTSYTETLEWINQKIINNQKCWIATPNPEIILKANEDEKFIRILNQADLRISDGIGLSIAASYLEKIYLENRPGLWKKIWLWKKTVLEYILNAQSVTNILPQVSGDELVLHILKEAKNKHWKIFLLGGKKGNAKKASERISSRFGLETNYHEGATEISRETESEHKEIIQAINNLKPEILLVAYGAPWQEIWISQNIDKLETSVAMGVGGTVDDIAEERKTPSWLRERGLRWLWRLVKEPKRLGRIWNAVVVFGWKNIIETQKII